MSKAWSRSKTTEEAMQEFPDMWNVTAEESEKRNPTQIASTVSTYRNIYNILKAEGFDGEILDASSGLGYGTRAGREEFGFAVDDIEPYPDADYEPKYTDYSKLNKKYDVIISSAVLNVLPQDQRDALVKKMGDLLKDGGRIFITTRGNDVNTLANSGKNIQLGPSEWIETARGSYQKGFTNPELIAYLKDALGEGYRVVAAGKNTGGKFNNNTAVVVYKDVGAAQKFSLTRGLTGKTFPPYNESRSDANERASRWARRDDVLAGDQKLASYHGRWYIIEKFDSSELGYQIVESIKAKDYEYYERRINDENAARRQSVREGTDFLDRVHQPSDTDGQGRPDTDSYEAQYRGTDNGVQSMGQRTSGRRGTESDRAGDSQSRSTDQQGAVKRSLSEAAADETRRMRLDEQIARLNDGRKIAYAKKYLGTNAEVWNKIEEAESRSKTSPPIQLQEKAFNSIPSTDNRSGIFESRPSKKQDTTPTTESQETVAKKHSLSEDKRLEELVNLLDCGASPSVVYNQTGLAVLGNGSIVNPEAQDIIGRYERGTSNKGRVLPVREDSEQGTLYGRSAGESVDTSAGTPSKKGIKGWGELTEGQREAITKLVHEDMVCR